jgi:alpha-tubulin suppressor-like RCC1 family protein
VVVSVGATHACALTGVGRVFCWGDNQNGQLGQGNRDAYDGPVEVPEVRGASAVVAADGPHGIMFGDSLAGAFTCALTADRGLSCWGANSDGQLGLGDRIGRDSPTAVPGLARVRDVHAGFRQICAVHDDGGISCWGSNSDASLASLTPAPVDGITGAERLAVGTLGACAVRAGDVRCFGVGETTAGPVVPEEIDLMDPSPVVDVAAADAHFCALTATGFVYCWGFDEYGVLGTTTPVDDRLPRLADQLPGPVDAIAAGHHHSCALREGAVLCWGYNDDGSLGTADPTGAAARVEHLERVIQLDVGTHRTCAVTETYEVLCWGPGEPPTTVEIPVEAPPPSPSCDATSSR